VTRPSAGEGALGFGGTGPITTGHAFSEGESRSAAVLSARESPIPAANRHHIGHHGIGDPQQRRSVVLKWVPSRGG